MSSSPSACGVRIVSTGSAVPDAELTNKDLEKILDTSDEWIHQRTGITSRRISDPAKEGTFTLARDAVKVALDRAGWKASELDLIICASCTQEMTCPSTACRIGGEIGAKNAGAFDLVAACSGFVYAMNVADTLLRSGRFKRIAVVGADAMSTAVDYTDRAVSILFGDAAGAAMLEADPDPMRGCIHQTLGSDGSDWHTLYMPRRSLEIPPEDAGNPIRLGYLRMHGREVFRFAVSKFREVIENALNATKLRPADVSQFICHQSNRRIIESAIEKLHLPPEKVHINIDRFGNSSAGSVGLCLDQLWQDGKIPAGKPMIMVAFGGGLTWASGVWNV